jgi:hypothetical protein
MSFEEDRFATASGAANVQNVRFPCPTGSKTTPRFDRNTQGFDRTTDVRKFVPDTLKTEGRDAFVASVLEHRSELATAALRDLFGKTVV